jgi:L-aspartate oxidase
MKYMSDTIETEVLIIGCGIAGGTAAFSLAEQGIPVTVVTRTKDPKETNTYYAQGGIIYKGENDSPQLLSEDIQRAGANHCYPEAVNILAEQGPNAVEKILIKKLKIEFDRTETGKLSLAREGSHSVARILHVKDTTGKSIENSLMTALQKHPNITLFSGFTAIDLLTPSHHSRDRLQVYQKLACAGAYLLDQQKKRVVRCLAKKTILASGGLGQIFLRSSNPEWARGDGIAMAYRAGARMINCEYIQFHPTTFHYKQAPHFLISEAVRGAGAKLVNSNSDLFMQKYDPEWKDLAPRDIVSRSIHQEMLEHGAINVYLDFNSYLSTEEIKDKFPNIYQNCLSYGIDPAKELVPVVPSAHYFCGGIWVDKWGQSTINNLYAIGEVSCTGVHGANRLASASLLEGLVWGERSAVHISENLANVKKPKIADYPSWRMTGLEKLDPALIKQDMSSIKNIMWNYVGLVRSTPRLARALRELRNLESEIEVFYRNSQLTDSLIGLRNAVRTSIVVTLAAWENKTSKGCHYRV